MVLSAQPELEQLLSSSHYIQCLSDTCLPCCVCFPAVAITEFGSDCDLFNGLSTRACAGTDAKYLQDFAAYLNSSAGVIPARFSKPRTTVWYWWSWNANSGDTGGLVSGSRPGPWYTVKWYKVRYLEGIGLCPWFRAAGSCA